MPSARQTPQHVWGNRALIAAWFWLDQNGDMSDVTRILSQIQSGDPHAGKQLLPLVYDELRKLAAAKLAHEKPGQTLQATALVHEVFLKLVDAEKVQHWDSRAHFFAAAAEAMRRILVQPLSGVMLAEEQTLKDVSPTQPTMGR